MTQADVLLPEQERVTIGVAENTLLGKLLTYCSDGLDSFNEIGGLLQASQVERELGKLDQLGSGNWVKGREKNC